MRSSIARFLLYSVSVFYTVGSMRGQSTPRPPNTNAYYQALRGLLAGGETAQVKEFVLTRDAAVFTFHSGGFAFYGEVNGKITGAVFRGQGSLHLEPPIDEERRSIALLTKEPKLDEEFDTAVLRFTDNTVAEIRKAATGKGPSDGANTSAGQRLAEALRSDIHWNLDVRLLEDVLSPRQGGFFLAAINGRKYASKMMFLIDPQGAHGVTPEEVELMTWNDTRSGIWTAFHYSDEYKQGIASGNEANDPYTIDHQDLDVTLARNGNVSAVATTAIRSRSKGMAVVPLRLYPTLRVSSVQDAEGHQLDFIQENKDKDPDFAVILPTPLAENRAYPLKITYAGKDVVHDEGGGNYYVEGGARESWYPSAREGGLGSYATYHLTLHIPKGLDIVATGEQVRETVDGNQTVSEWKDDIPIPVAGFNIGRFKKLETKLTGGFTLQAYANTEVPDNVVGLAGSGAMGTMNTTMMLKNAMAQGEVALGIYSEYFGKLQFHNLALTQQTPCSYGQSWPMLVYLPICSFWDTTVRHNLGLDRGDRMYWKVVTPHEIAHQWWGQTVSFRSYRDQWMSEGFANFSASIFLQTVNKNNNEFRNFWKEQRHLITDKNPSGFRPIDVGPVTMGYRLSNDRSGYAIYQDLVYPKGAYILHMLRMMNWNPKDGDAWLETTLHDFVSTYSAKPATTEDFKAILEKHMNAIMDLDGNHRLDWFFNQFVYGTDLPTYSFSSEVSQSAEGPAAHFKLVQSNVKPTFKMLVPIYAELADGFIARIANVLMLGNTGVEKTFRLPPSKSPVKRLMINYYNDVLCIQE